MGGKSIAHRAAQYRQRQRARYVTMAKYHPLSADNPNALGKRSGKFPNCIDFFDDCPPQINDPNNPPDQCKTCPKYRESKYFRPKKREIPEFLRKKLER